MFEDRVGACVRTDGPRFALRSRLVTQSFTARFGLWRVPTTRTCPVALSNTLQISPETVSTTLKHQRRILNRSRRAVRWEAQAVATGCAWNLQKSRTELSSVSQRDLLSEPRQGTEPSRRKRQTKSPEKRTQRYVPKDTHPKIRRSKDVAPQPSGVCSKNSRICRRTPTHAIGWNLPAGRERFLDFRIFEILKFGILELRILSNLKF